MNREVKEAIAKAAKSAQEFAESMKALCDAVEAESGTPSEVVKETTESEPSEPEQPSVSREEVRAVLAKKSRAKHTQEVRDLIKEFGADCLSDVDPKYYAELMRRAEEIKDA